MINFDLIPHTLTFNFNARTSRGALKTMDNIFIKATDENGNIGWGEICRIPGLSIDENVDYSTVFPSIADKVSQLNLNSSDQVLQDLENIVPDEMPALRMGLETAILDLMNGGGMNVFPGKFGTDDSTIVINGLIWMGHSEDMLKQVNEKIYDGFNCIKIKIGGIDFDIECDILDYIRRRYFKQEITIRLDANGSFSDGNALNKLHRLAEYNIHSIEQPLIPGSSEMSSLIQESPIPVALDEELIGVDNPAKLLDDLNPKYLVFKPSLLGGFAKTKRWIVEADKRGIGWWITSALESNIGLNAIAQFTSHHDNSLHQGLGTGSIYENNFESPLKVLKGTLTTRGKTEWNIDFGSDD